jgi:hypothetical protein
MLVLATLAACPALAGKLFHKAENDVPVAIVEVSVTAGYTEVRLETQAPRSKVCWSSSGPNSPYLLASGTRYRLVGGDNITDCPKRMDYADHQIMVLRFAPLPPQVREFALVEGEGGENQMIDPASRTGTKYWNFLHVKLN